MVYTPILEIASLTVAHRLQLSHKLVGALTAILLLELALTTFPANASFLAAYIEGRGAHTRFQRRRFLAATCRAHPDCPQLWLAASRFELAATAAGTAAGQDHASSGHVQQAVAEVSGGEQRARALLEAALRPQACAGCVALWRAYIDLELRAGRHAAACRVLLRAVQQCPGHKGLWCDALRPPLLAVAPLQQLRDTVVLVAEKELRLRAEPPEAELLADEAGQPAPRLREEPRVHHERVGLAAPYSNSFQQREQPREDDDEDNGMGRGARAASSGGSRSSGSESGSDDSASGDTSSDDSEGAGGGAG